MGETPTVTMTQTLAASGPPTGHLLPAVHAHPDTVKAGMFSFLLSEVAFFSTLIMVFIYYLNRMAAETPNPKQVFRQDGAGAVLHRLSAEQQPDHLPCRAGPA